jgi:hypothetical protein
MNEAQDELVEEPQHPFRGSIRHIQSDEEMNFHVWEDAVEFIRRYVPLDHGPDVLTGTEKGLDDA